MFYIEDFNTGSVCHFRDFASKPEMQNLYLEFKEPVDRIAGYNWWFGLIKEAGDNGITVTPLLSWSYLLYTPWLIRYPWVSIRVLFEPVNHLGKANEEFKFMDQFFYGTGTYIWGKRKKMYLSEILDTKNGWLSEDGTFTWNVGFSIDALQDKQGCWRFNFLDVPFNTKWGPDMVKILDDEEYKCVITHILMLKLHCPRLPELMNKENRIVGCPRLPIYSSFCLNILHGFQARFEFETDEHFFGVLEIAKHLGFPNVLHYCERQLIEGVIPIGDIEDKVSLAIQADFNQYLSILLRELKRGNELLEILEKVDIVTHGVRCGFRDFASKGEMQNIYLEFNEPSKRISGYNWWIGLVKKTDDRGIYVVPLFHFPCLLLHPFASVRVLIEPVNHLGVSNEEFKYTDRFYYETGSYIWGKNIYLSEVLDTKNGWLSEDGTFTWNVGFCVEGVMTPGDIWEFNFLQFPFKCFSAASRVIISKENNTDCCLVSHIIMFKLHCSKLSEVLTPTNFIFGCPCWPSAYFCLNVLHGVQTKFDTNEKFFGVLEIAKLYGFRNVLHYCERQLIEDAIPIGDIEDKILLAIQANFNQYLSILLKDLKQGNEFLEILKKADIGMMSGESMKIFLKKLL